MDHELRLSALANLVPIRTGEVELRLLAELDRVEETLQKSTDYDDLSNALKALAVLSPRFHARVMPLLADFVLTVSTRQLKQGEEPIPRSWRRYRSASHLIREAIDVPRAIRFVHLVDLLDFLLGLWASDDDDVRTKAARAMEALAEFDLNVFYGERGLGARPQMEIVTYFSNLGDDAIVRCAEIIFAMLSKVLSPSIEGHSWSYSSMTISRGAIPAAAGVPEMRLAAISLLKRMHLLNDDFRFRKSALDTLNTATRCERADNDTGAFSMFERDAVAVLDFLRERVPKEMLPLVQAIEHDAYWNYYHAISNVVAEAALSVRDAIEVRTEYQIYKQLIGFEGIHGVWEDLKNSKSSWEYGDEKRLQAAAHYVDEIDESNIAAWRDRIIEFSATQSNDLATFPVYYEFLKIVGLKRPDLALELVRDYEDLMRPFSVALLRGLWSSERKEAAEAIVSRWISESNNLVVAARSLNVDEEPRLDLLLKIVTKADAVGDADALIEAMGVAVRQFARGHIDAKVVFMRGLRSVSSRGDARWANMVWLGQDFKKLIKSLQPDERAEILSSIGPLPKLHYQAEELLYALGQHDPMATLGFLMDRIRKERASDEAESSYELNEEERFEAVPYSLVKLGKLLATMPHALMAAIRSEFDIGGASYFPYRGGARLIKAAFPDFDQPLQDELLSYLEARTPTDVAFVIAVVRAFGGGASVLPVCKEVIKVVPEQSSAWNGVAAALESTGVVSGEYGLSQAYETRRSQITPWIEDENPKVRAFATWLIDDLDRLILRERARADEQVALRKHKYAGRTGDS